ncbi:hypothetical protein BC938DRAFT_481445 [Jimgerdemannia flammicorona]|uniref:Uncharacterized protein n=1 Tax=Jimgerdemannia flammicorona TaxID=994334 RepID=A0A433QG49_9FUNG|nr:hypothetical protein BC938DRAFT_481445 [Jimgerdemannia flammicorona]
MCLSEFNLCEFDLCKFDLGTFDLSEFDLDIFDLGEFNLYKFDLYKFDLSMFDLLNYVYFAMVDKGISSYILEKFFWQPPSDYEFLVAYLQVDKVILLLYNCHMT